MRRSAHYWFVFSYTLFFTILFMVTFFAMRDHTSRDLVLVIIFAFAFVCIIPTIMVLRYPLYKAFGLYHQGNFEALLKYGEKHLNLVLSIDVENMHALVAVACFTLYDDVGFITHMKYVKHKNILPTKYAFLSIYYGVHGHEPECLDNYLLFKEHANHIHPFSARVRFLKLMKNFHLVITGQASQTVYEDIILNNKNPRITKFIQKFKPKNN